MFGGIVAIFAMILGGAYFITLSWVFIGLFKVKRKTKEQRYKSPFVSVILAVRDEEANLSECLESLLNQTYPKELYEVITVDDNSTDSTSAIAESFAKRDERVQLLSSTKKRTLTGKQSALDTGIRASKGEIILSTDADCQAPPTWIENVVREFDDNIGLVAGFSVFNEAEVSKQNVPQRIFTRLQALLLLSFRIVSIGSAHQGMAWACTGQNIAYRREVYEEFGGYENLCLAGAAEDSLLLQWVDKHSKWESKVTNNLVYTKPTKTLRQFMAQSDRWASNPLQNRLSLILFMMVTYVLNLLVIVMAGLSLLGMLSYTYLIVLLGLKIIPDFLVVLKGLPLFRRTSLIKYFPILQPLHTIYVLAFGIRGFSKKFAWKGRKY